MSDPDSKPVSTERRLRIETLLAFVLIVAISAVVLDFDAEEGNYSMEALQRASIASDLLSVESRGRQALVGSLDYPPLPTVVLTLLSLLPGLGPDPVLSRVVGFSSLLVLGLYLFRAQRHDGVPLYVCAPALLALLLLPAVNHDLVRGTSALFLLALLIPAMGFFYRWLRLEKLHDVAFSAVLFAAAVLSGYQAIIIVLICLPFLVIRSSLRNKKAVVQATVIVFILPTAYVIALWFGGNWLIMGDPMFHVKHWYAKAIAYPVPLWYSFLSDFPWSLCAVVMGLFFAPVVLTVAEHKRRLRRSLQPVSLALVFIVAAAGLAIQPREHVLVSRETQIFTRYLINRYSSDAFLVVGYDGYEFLKAIPPEERRLWKHVMRLDRATVQKTIADFQGRKVLLILPAQPTAEFLADLSLDLRPYTPAIPDTLLLVEHKDKWLIFECLPGTGLSGQAESARRMGPASMRRTPSPS